MGAFFSFLLLFSNVLCPVLLTDYLLRMEELKSLLSSINEQLKDLSAEKQARQEFEGKMIARLDSIDEKLEKLDLTVGHMF